MKKGFASHAHWEFALISALAAEAGDPAPLFLSLPESRFLCLLSPSKNTRREIKAKRAKLSAIGEQSV